ncbi:MAG: ABC transporter ATP-binding protein [Deltaproteobacteria bacterium RIFOXYD12_FULL_50_9]|nr:MAG: ABC transporter ATP-binding protein [Deltaproteobacteria bacterium RIFOXYD12_FULL_50_9]
MSKASPLLALEDVHTFYGRVHALKGISLTIAKGEIVALIGANGAGKSTALMTICGRPNSGSGRILFRGEEINSLDTDRIVRLGISLVPEGRHIFPRMTVRENLDLGTYLRSDHIEIARDLDQVFDLFPLLKERTKQLAGTLSGGEQQMLAIARALMSRPRLLLLDEPSMGLAPLLVKQIFSIIAEINRSGTTILLVEQNAFMALKIAARAYVMATGLITHSGSSSQILLDDTIRAAYLGG